MAKRRDNFRNFDIGAKSPHVLDLSGSAKFREAKQVFSAEPARRANKAAVRRKNPKKFQEGVLSRENLLLELESIENYDAKLASTLRIPLSIERHPSFPQASEEEEKFLNKELELFLEPQRSDKPRPVSSGNTKSIRKIFSFAFISCVLTAFIFGAFFAQKSIVAQNEDSQMSQSSSKLSFALSAVKPFSFSGIPDLGNKIPVFLNVIGVAKDFYGIAPALFGYEEPKRYIVVFQNSSELRPTGGFIGTYAIAEISDGELLDLSIDGIYNIDGQLAVNVVPPKPFQHIATAWSTHDANWFLDFPSSAEKIMWFYEKTGGGKLDGVMTLNIEVVEKLLALTGPVALAEYDLALDEKNFRDEIQYQVEVAYDKELNRPKKILADFAPLFFEELSDTLQSASNEAIDIITKSLEEKDIMFYSKDNDVLEFFEKQGWAGQIPNSQFPIPNDYLAVAHSNIGGHKTSKYMEDEIIHDVEIEEDGSIIDTLTLKRTHNGGDAEYWWYNRKNIDYVKIYVPQGSEIVSYSGGMRREAESSADYKDFNFVEDPDVAAIEGGMRQSGPIDIFTETGKTVFGTWLVTSPKKTTEFKIRYKLPHKIEFKNKIAKYHLCLQKQPGTRAQTSVGVSYPESWGVVWSNVDKPDESFALDKDRMIGYIFER